jgi:Tfp pilus assembly protein PilO
MKIAVWDMLSNWAIMQYVYFIIFIVVIVAVTGWYLYKSAKEQG